MSDDDTEVTFKIPHRFLIYIALGLGGGGAAWNKVDNYLSSDQHQRMGRVTYMTLAAALDDVLDRVELCEERLDELEDVGFRGRRGRLRRDSDRNGGAVRAYSARSSGGHSGVVAALGEEESDEEMVVEEPIVKRTLKRLPNFAEVQKTAEAFLDEEPEEVEAGPAE